MDSRCNYCWKTYTVTIVGKLILYDVLIDLEANEIMKASTIIALISILVVCHFCKKDFKVLGRHSWQCKSKPMNLTSNSNHGESITIAEKVPCNNDFIHCMCGKKCKGVRGLKRHQRSCRTIKSFSEDIINDLQANYNSDSNNDHFEVNESQLDELNEDSPQLKSGVKLPNSQEDWKLANDFFHTHLPIENITNENMNEIVNNFNNTVYS